MIDNKHKKTISNLLKKACAQILKAEKRGDFSDCFNLLICVKINKQIPDILIEKNLLPSESLTFTMFMNLLSDKRIKYERII